MHPKQDQPRGKRLHPTSRIRAALTLGLVLSVLSFLLRPHSGLTADAPARPDLHLLQPVPIPQVTVDDAFWAPKLKVWREITIADCFTKFEKDGALANFDRIRDGQKGPHSGPP